MLPRVNPVLGWATIPYSKTVTISRVAF